MRLLTRYSGRLQLHRPQWTVAAPSVPGAPGAPVPAVPTAPTAPTTAAPPTAPAIAPAAVSKLVNVFQDLSNFSYCFCIKLY